MDSNLSIELYDYCDIRESSESIGVFLFSLLFNIEIKNCRKNDMKTEFHSESYIHSVGWISDKNWNSSKP